MSAPDRAAVIVLDLDARTARLEMPDHDARVIAYAIDPDHEGDEVAYVVTRHDREAGPYRVSKLRRRPWRCTCESFRFKKGPFAPFSCKHAAACAVLKSAVLDHLQPLPETLPMPKAKPDTAETPARTPDVTAGEMRRRLAEPFHPDEIGWLPKSVKDNRALAIAFVTARAVMDRLDDVVGIENWSDEYECLADGNVVCRLSVRLGGEWVTKTDVGGESEQPDAGDKCKSSFSDALKRAAVKFGIARYVYHLPKQWCDYDPKRRQFARTPTLPAWALPGAKTPPPPPPQEAPEDSPQPTAAMTAVAGQGVAVPATAAPPHPGTLPVGAEQIKRIERLIKQQGKSEGAFLKRLGERYGVGKLSELTAAQADEVEAAMRPSAKAS